MNMKKFTRALALLCAVGFSVTGFSQVFWTEDFGTGCDQGNLANGTITANGGWTVTNTGANGGGANEWFISATEAGMGVGNCGDGCLATPASTSRTLHVGNTSLGTAACFFCPTGDCGAAYSDATSDFGFCPGSMDPTMNKRAESPTIDCSGQTGITLDLAYITGAQPGVDFCTVEYFDGVAWSSLGVPAPTATGPCAAPQHQWAAYSVALPASADNNANVRIGFRWQQVVDDGGADPSFAVDDITLTAAAVAGPTADFSASATNLCEGDCIDFTDLSTLGAGPYVFDWQFAGGTPATSAVQNPVGICYNAAGTYQVQLTVTDINGTDTETKVGYITVTAAPDADADNSGNACNNAIFDVNTLLGPGADPGGTWAETSGTPSGQFNTATGELDGNGLPVGNVYTFEYTVNGVAPCAGSDVAVFTITIVDCSAGVITASFTPSDNNICVGDCITFTENSIGAGIIGWGWQFTNGTPALAGTQNPGSVCFNTPGVQPVTLTITDGTTSDDTTINITVNALPTVGAVAAPGTDICTGDPVTLSGTGATSYVWDNGVTNNVAFTPASTLTYTVTGTDANLCSNIATITITVAPCIPVVAGFEYPDNICISDCITLTDTSSGTPISWNWDFGGGATPNTSTDQNPVVCFDTAGTYDIQLTVQDAGGNSSSTTNTISVFDVPTVIAELDSVIEIGGYAELLANGSGPGSYLWTSVPEDSEMDCDTCSLVYARPEVTTDFTVVFTDDNGCTAVDSVKIYVNFIEGIGIPQAFSPNGDGNNDVLYVRGYGIETMSFVIYNRYGQKVFETLDQNVGWDGKFNGRDENPGVFVWVLEYTFITGNGGTIKGNTTLVR